jgi:carbamoyl-phosphate synthase large subunit
MENLDPMGVHTGESIVVAPSQTLDNQDYHFLREIAIKVANHFKIVGECNIQYAFNSYTGEYRVIEINPRLSRSSALASKATGYPLAYVAAKLALGFKLYELKNTVTQETCAFFEPALDYIVVKLPRWDIHKLREADRRIGTEMKSVGEVMAIGRSFPEALQKAVGMLNIGLYDLADFKDHALTDHLNEMLNPTDRRLFVIYDYFRQGHSVEEVKKATQINDWFLNHIHQIAQYELSLQTAKTLEPQQILQAKKLGFSDVSLGRLFKMPAQAVRDFRLQHKIIPYIKQIDTLAGEFAAKSNYLYLTYHAQSHDIEPSSKPLVIVLGSGPYSIGSSVEFDWCAVNTVRTLRSLGYTTALINSNPETVSTDYDESDRLYFEQLSFERVCDIASFENLLGIIISVGGQIANNLALPLAKANFPILGTDPKNIDTAENRQLFSARLNELHIDQPAWVSVVNLEGVKKFIETVHYPVLIRPSYVLSGAAMNVVYNEKELMAYLGSATDISPDNPVVISKFIDNAKELEIDGVARHGEVVIQAISEHIENAGVHSGDATIVLPPQQLYLETIRRTKQITRKIIKTLGIHGPFNIQFLAKDNAIQVIECNVRASRSFPFVSKVCHHNLIEIATKVLLDKPIESHYETLELDYVGVKTPQFSYRRLKGANPVAHVEMASTGEVACLGDDLMEAFFRSWLSTDQSLSKKNLFVSIGSMGCKHKLLAALKALEAAGWELFATYGTHEFLSKNGVGSICLFKILEGKTPNVQDYVMDKAFDLIINIPNGNKTLGEQFTDGYQLRRLAIEHQIPLITNLQLAQLMLKCLVNLNERKLSIKSWQDFMAHRSVKAELDFFDL